MSEKYVLELQHITKKYPGVLALNDVSIQVKPGEILGLVGENGAGKSTLIKTCSGVVKPDSGKIVIDGEEFSSMTPRLSEKHGIAIIYQEFNNVRGLSVAENMFLGNPITKKGGLLIDKRAMEKQALKTFEQLNVNIKPSALVGNISVGYQQMVEIAKAIKQDAKVIIMDEPTAALAKAEVHSLYKVCELLRSQGIAIIYISHRLDEIFHLTDRIVVLRDGQYIKTLQTSETNVDELIKLMVGRDLNETYPPRGDFIDKDKVILELQNVTAKGFKNVSFKINKGEILGVSGFVGAGRTEMAEALFGISKKEEGNILFNGKELDVKGPRQAIDAGIALVPEDRKQQGAILQQDITKNINMPTYKKISKASVINSRIEKETAKKYKDEMRIKTPSLIQLVKNLSGGNQQKVVIGKWLAANSELIILDEPTRGIDVGAKYEIYKLMNDLIEEGKTILMISSELEELMGMADRIIVLSEGKLMGELDKKDFEQDRIMRMASGLN